jgi:hypothetical protein
LQEPVGATEDGPLDGAQVADQFASRPPPVSWPRFPLVRWDGIGRPQKVALRPSQVLYNGRKRSHRIIQKYVKDSDGSSSGLLEGMGQLQDTRLSKSRSEDL